MSKIRKSLLICGPVEKYSFKRERKVGSSIFIFSESSFSNFNYREYPAKRHKRKIHYSTLEKDDFKLNSSSEAVSD